ncbi:MAG: ABC transporter permease [Proteobacteria bacterium]|nr:ABC transporter permease [Pseudomonadota bacterium]
MIAFVPVMLVAWIYFRWSLNTAEVGVAVVRMAAQLLLIGYVLAWLFEQQHAAVLGFVMLIMALVSTWISLRKVKQARAQLFLKTLLVISASSLFILLIVVAGVLSLIPTEHSRVVIPLAGMIFSSAMTAVGLAAERYKSDRDSGSTHIAARNKAFNASLIPITNSMLAVGLVALPGMMTGQILSGVSPLLAVRYQIVVMCMIFGVAGLSSALFLHWVARDMIERKTSL